MYGFSFSFSFGSIKRESAEMGLKVPALPVPARKEVQTSLAQRNLCFTSH